MVAPRLQYRTEIPCADCLFNDDGPGLHLRQSLGPVRWKEIITALKAGRHFTCHKTTKETGNGSNLVCAGSIAFQARTGITSDYLQVCERLIAMHQQREP